jgi:hypothetical protein
MTRQLLCASNGKAQSTVPARAPRAQIAHVEKSNDFKPDIMFSAGRRNAADVTGYGAARWRVSGKGHRGHPRQPHGRGVQLFFCVWRFLCFRL